MVSKHRFCWIFCFFVFLVARETFGLIDCTDAILENSFVGTCNNKWKNLNPILKPTQAEVGYAWIQYKLENDFTSSKDAQAKMDESATPAVIGPGPAIYIVDDHHTLSALDYSGYSDTTVTITILCDKRNLSASVFWSSMNNQNLAYLAAHPAGQPNVLPKEIPYTAIPTTFSFTKTIKSFADDPWRSLAGYSRKVQSAASPAPTCSSSSKDDDSKYCERCMYRGCVDGYEKSGSGVAYFEFRWSYFMNAACYDDNNNSNSYWPSIEEYHAFMLRYTALPYDNNNEVFTSSNTIAWMDCASYIVNLCRSDSVSKYILPTVLYPPLPNDSTNTLPGYFAGYTKLPNDPDCSLPVCI